MLATSNSLLGTVPRHLLAQWQRHFSLVELSKGQILDLDDTDSVLYFPVNCVLGIHVRAADGPWTFLRFSGNRHVAGLAGLIEVGSINVQGRVCGAGYALTLPKAFAREQLPKSLLGDNPHAFAMSRIAEYGLRSAYCGSSHSASQRLASLLLLAADCFGTDRPITLSQQEVCELLLVRRETVASLLSAWASEGLVATHRARISISQADALRRRACLCYPSWSRLIQEEERTWAQQACWNPTPPLGIAPRKIAQLTP